MLDPHTQALLLARRLAEVDLNTPEEDLEFPPPQPELTGLTSARRWLGRQLVRLGQSLGQLATVGVKSDSSSEVPC